MKSLKNYGKIYVSSNTLVHNGFVSLYHLKVKMVTYTFQKLLHWKQGFPQVQFLLFTFKSDALSSTDMAKKVYHVDDHYTRYGINFMVTPKAPCFLLGPNESRDTQCFDNWCNPWSTLLLLPLSMHQCCIISTFAGSIFNYLL